MRIRDINNIEFILKEDEYLVEAIYDEKITLTMRQGTDLNEAIVENNDTNQKIIGLQLKKQIEATRS